MAQTDNTDQKENKQPIQLQKSNKLSHISKSIKLSAKQEAFAKEFAKTKNGTLSALKVYDTTDYKTAGVIATENLAKPKIKFEIMQLLQQNDVELSQIVSTHKRNMLQDKHFPTSQKAVSDFYDILGMKSPDKDTTSTKIAFIIEEK